MSTTGNGRETMQQLGWEPGFWDHINNEVIAPEANRIRKLQGVLPKFGDQQTDPNAIPSYEIEVQKTETQNNGSGYVASIPRQTSIIAAEIESVFELRLSDQLKNHGEIEHLATQAANRVAL